jgi:hypothetical protein
MTKVETLPISSIFDKMTAQEVRDKAEEAEEEGVGYFCECYTSPDGVESERIGDAMRQVEEAIKNFHTVVEEECLKEASK